MTKLGHGHISIEVPRPLTEPEMEAVKTFVTILLNDYPVEVGQWEDEGGAPEPEGGV